MMIQWIIVVSTGLAPLIHTIGSWIWRRKWKGSSFSLDMIKYIVGASCFAACLFFIDIVSFTPSSLLLNGSLAVFHLISGDILWYYSLKWIGLRRSLAISSVRAVLGLAAGKAFLRDVPLFWEVLVSCMSSLGLALVSISYFPRDSASNSNEIDDFSVTDFTTNDMDSVVEGSFSEEEQIQLDHIGHKSSNSINMWGYPLCILHIVIDVLVCTIFRMNRDDIDSFSINIIRYGVAALLFVLTSICSSVIFNPKKFFRSLFQPRAQFSLIQQENSSPMSPLEIEETHHDVFEQGVRNSSPVEDLKSVCWYEIPFQDMELSDWCHTLLGSLFMSVLYPWIFFTSLLNLTSIYYFFAMTSLNSCFLLPLLLGQKFPFPKCLPVSMIVGIMFCLIAISLFCWQSV